ncbi:hypothetical protein RIVM261_076560 [Rivularia sp. IAM M-261]|nr:hypothetical protein RIVM261_076560 [Rivularia sp. IAM M-261]
MVTDALDKPGKHNYNEFGYALEIFDQLGLLVGVLFGETVYFGKHLYNRKSEFIAWLIDGELVVFAIGKEIIINRIF